MSDPYTESHLRLILKTRDLKRKALELLMEISESKDGLDSDMTLIIQDAKLASESLINLEVGLRKKYPGNV